MRRRARTSAYGSFLFVAASLISNGAAARTENERTLAEALFRQARELMDQGNYDAACPKFAESQRLDPGGGTLLNLAVCHEKQGKFASAWGEFQEALAQAKSEGREARVSLAEERIAVLEPQLARVTINVAKPSLPGLVITVNGTPLGSAGWGAAMPIDAGTLSVEAKARGYQSFVKVVQIRNRESLAIEVPELVRTATGAGTEAPKTEAEPTATAPDNTFSYVTGGLGVLAIGAGTYFGVRAIQKHRVAERYCDDTCSPEGSDEEQSAVFNGWLSTASFAVGIAALWVSIHYYSSDPGEPAKGSDQAFRILPQLGRESAGLDVTFRY